MARVVAIYDALPLALTDGRTYTAQACGRERADRTWEGWLEFVPDDRSVVLRSKRETTQPNLGALEYWASGLTAVYLVGALERTLAPPPVVVDPPEIPAVYDEPAPPNRIAAVAAAEPDPILDPFSVYATGEDILHRRLAALSARQLRTIIVGYHLANPSNVDLDALDAAELIALIVAAVRDRSAT